MYTIRTAQKLLVTTVSILAIYGCGADDESSQIEFRASGLLTDVVPFNTNSIWGGSAVVPVDKLPLTSGGVSGVEILAIRASSCLNSSNQVITGKFSTTGSVSLSLSSAGVLGSLTVANVNTPTVTCTISGNLWVDTEWDIRVQTGVDPTGAPIYHTDDLRLAAANVDSLGLQAYEFQAHDATGSYQPTCDDDGSSSGLQYHAYLIPNLHVDSSTGELSFPTTSSMYVACRSGAVGKAMDWGYGLDNTNADTHELATRMVRADYCGNSTANTSGGNDLVVHDDIGVWPNPPSSAPEIEAVWDETGAVCVSNPRESAASLPFSCGVTSLPVCTSSHLETEGVIVSWVPST